MGKGFFITGTDTNVGKTVLSALLCAALPATYWKPVQTGALEGTDRQNVISWTGISAEGACGEAYIFDDPVSPHLAARRAGSEIQLEKIARPQSCDPLIVEGAGGVLVPFDHEHFMTDLMRQLGLPVVLAARSTLGTINHTLMSLKCLRDAGLDPRGVVLIGPENPDNCEAIEHYGNTRVIGQIPVLQKINRETLLEVFRNNFVHEAFL